VALETAGVGLAPVPSSTLPMKQRLVAVAGLVHRRRKAR
jgi:hypothetical protein